MARAKKSWSEKLRDVKDLPKIKEIPPRLKKKFGDGIMVIPSPLEVDEFMRMVPEGKLVTKRKYVRVLPRNIIQQFVALLLRVYLYG